MRLARTLALQKIPPMEGERPREPHPRRPVWAFNGDGKRIAGIRKCATAIIIARNGCMCGTIPCAKIWLKRPTNGLSRENCMRYSGNRRLRCGLRGRYWVLGIGYLVFGETRENFLNSTGSRGRSPSSVFPLRISARSGTLSQHPIPNTEYPVPAREDARPPGWRLRALRVSAMYGTSSQHPIPNTQPPSPLTPNHKDSHP